MSSDTPTGNVYQHPEGRYSMTLVGDWTQAETNGTYVQFARIIAIQLLGYYEFS